MSTSKKYGYVWVTLVVFAVSFIGHWAFAWSAFMQEQEEHNQPARFSKYFIQTARDTLENWQSEFLQLMWQVAGLSFLFFVGSPQSKENSERSEEKLDLILKSVSKNGEEEIKKLDYKYPRE